MVLEQGERCPKRWKGQKQPLIVGNFCDVHEVIFTNCLQKGKTVAGQHDVTLLERLNDEIKKYLCMKKKVLYDHDNASIHISRKAITKLN